MTEAEWLTATDPTPMLVHIRDWGSCRKHRLFGCECCRRIWHLLVDPRSREAVESAEHYADDQITQQQLSAAHVGADRAVGPPNRRNFVYARSSGRMLAFRSFVSCSAAKAVARPTNFLNKLTRSIQQTTHYALLAEFGDRYTFGPSRTQHSDLLRCIFGNPFQPTIIDPIWFTSDVYTLAEGIYQDRAFDRMPILADALQDGGCDNEDILNHCRQSGEHVRGCWVVDLLLGKN